MITDTDIFLNLLRRLWSRKHALLAWSANFAWAWVISPFDDKVMPKYDIDVYDLCCRQPRIGKLLNCISLIFWTGYDTLGNVYSYAFFALWLRDYAGQFLFVSGQRAQTLDTPWSVDANDLSERAIFP